MDKFDFTFGGRNASELGVKATQRPNMPAAVKKIEETNVAAMDGSYYLDQGTYEDIPLPYSCNFLVPDCTEWDERVREIKDWLFHPTGPSQLIKNDDPEYYLRVRKVETSEFTRIYRRLAQFTVTFTCTAYQYLVRGGTRVPCPEVVNNQYETAYPVFYVTTKYPKGNTATITVNGNAVTVQITTPTTIIDVERRMVYTGDYKIVNGNATGDLDGLVLVKGTNTIKFGGTKNPATLEYVPNWRRL